MQLIKNGGDMNICDGIDDIVDTHLGLTGGKSPHYKHQTSCFMMHEKPEDVDAYEMLKQMSEILEENRTTSVHELFNESPPLSTEGP